MIDRFYRQLENIHVNCEKPRAYFVPFERKTQAFECREKSEFFTLLNGEWDFEFFKNVEELDIEKDGFTSGIICRDKMTVPFCWQLKRDRGYDVPNYINQDYPYPVDPPFLPDTIPCGFYRKKINFAKKNNKKYYINFEGVASCFYLWVNGIFKGYSQVSHCTSEFEITDLLADGENTFEVLVVKWCTGSYMEDQDFFRLSGIFRDVYILERDEIHISDIFIDVDVADDFKSAEISVKAELQENAEISWEFVSPENSVVAQGKDKKDFCFKVENPQLWNAEIPALYTLNINVGEEYISLPVGIKRIEIKNKCLLLNGEKIKIRGINRHDSNPETGYAVSVDNMLEDLYILKRGNVNAIRTSHYPNDPRFLEMCDRLGFMVIDEADLESHGMGYNYGDWYWDYWAHLCDVPEWENSCIDRAQRLFERDKNHGCIIMWSLGNESGCGENHRKMANFIRSRQPKAIIHYENAHLEYEERVNGRDFKDISDVESRMYASLEYLEEYLNDEKMTKPFFYCEYVSAWSTGDIPLHWNDFEKYDNYSGGCIWELTDHAVNIGTKENPKYRYGGDFGDYPNDHIYCTDGLIFPNRKPRPGFCDMKITYQPFEMKYSDGKITIKNKYYFKSLSDYKFVWNVEENGKKILCEEITDTDINPQEEKTFDLKIKISPKNCTTLNLICLAKNETEWTEKDFEIGHKQFILSDEKIIADSDKKADLKLNESRTKIEIFCGQTEYVFDKITGKIISIKTDEELLKAPLGFAIMKPYIACGSENEKWLRSRFDTAYQKTYGSKITEQSEEKIVIETKASFAASAMPPAVKANIIYTFTSDGKLNVYVKADVTERAPVLPRFGIQLEVPDSFENIKYFGYGPIESYAERHKSQMLGLYETTVNDNFVHYIKPDENGAHYGTKFAEISDEKGHGILFEDTGKNGFVFNAKHYDDKQIIETKHDDELVKLDRTIINLDYKIHSDRQGNFDREPWISFDEKHFEFSYNILVY